MLARDKIINDAWASYLPTGGEGEAFDKGWMKTRYEALKQAGLNPIWQEW